MLAAPQALKELQALGAVAAAGDTRLLGLVNQNNDRGLGAAWMEIYLVNRLDITALSRINLDIGIRRKPLQLVDQLFDFHRVFLVLTTSSRTPGGGAAHAPSQTSPVCAPRLRPRAVGGHKPAPLYCKKKRFATGKKIRETVYSLLQLLLSIFAAFRRSRPGNGLW